jgi:hypothetical protein
MRKDTMKIAIATPRFDISTALCKLRDVFSHH